MDTIKEYIEKTNRRVTIEYILLKELNDDPIIKNINKDILFTPIEKIIICLSYLRCKISYNFSNWQ
mgnify:CR=1 FL=1